MSLRVLIVTNLFGDPWNTSRGTFNQQQFGRLAQKLDVRVLVPVSWLSVLRHPFAYRRLRRDAVQRWPYADYVIFWYVPAIGRRLHAAFLFASLFLQRFPTFFLMRWDCMLGSWGYPDAVAVGALSRMSGTPFVAKVHGSDINAFALEPARRAQIRWALNQARHVIAVSKALGLRLREIGVEAAHTSVLYNGVDPRRFHPLPRATAKQALGYAEDDRLILFVGNVQPSKGCGELLEAFARLSRRMPAVRLVYAGQGPQMKSLQSRATMLALDASVHFAGRIAHDQLLQWFAAADVLCLPSHAEGVPNVVLEAMACGTPVVATDVGGIAEVLPSYAGLLVPPKNDIALESALFTALHCEWDRERIVEHARGFDWDKNVAQLESLLRLAVLGHKQST